MGRLIKALALLMLLGAAALAGYAYFGDYRPAEREMSLPVTLDAD